MKVPRVLLLATSPPSFSLHPPFSSSSCSSSSRDNASCFVVVVVVDKEPKLDENENEVDGMMYRHKVRSEKSSELNANPKRLPLLDDEEDTDDEEDDEREPVPLMDDDAFPLASPDIPPCEEPSLVDLQTRNTVR